MNFTGIPVRSIFALRTFIFGPAIAQLLSPGQM